MRDRPLFLWDVEITDAEFRERLRHPDPLIRAQWQGVLLREGTFDEVWRYMTLAEVVRDFPNLRKHLGRRRAYWEWLLQGWRDDGHLAS